MSVPNPNRDHDWVDQYPELDLIEQARRFPQYFCKLHFDQFRHLHNLELIFESPITVVTGNNKSGKTTMLVAIACSHFNFQRRNVLNGAQERATWSDLMKFTIHDIQNQTWTYRVTFRQGTNIQERQGQRNYVTKKWNGVAKKAGQIGTPPLGSNQAGRQVTLIDLERIIPARHLPKKIFKEAKNHHPANVNAQVEEYLSYIFEEPYSFGEMYNSADNYIYGYNTAYSYSTYHTASGEDVLTRLLRDVVDAPNYSLILIEELEVGLHPKMQRRLMDVLYHEAHEHYKQFIVTTHSSTVLASVGQKSRLFIDTTNAAPRCIQGISVNAALSKMDAIAYPLVNLFVEDNVSKLIVDKAIGELTRNDRGFNHLVHVIITGNASKTYVDFKSTQGLYNSKKVRCGYACILDGDMRNIQSAGKQKFPPEELLFFHFGNFAPEKELLSAYLQAHPNVNLQYHCNQSDPHCLFFKMIEQGLCSTIIEAFDLCWQAFVQTAAGQRYFVELQNFIRNACQHFAPDL